jgi:glucose-1-phosphate thymidylyltransferase
MEPLKGLILATTSSDEDDIVRRLYGRSRYAMQLANRALVRYAAQALVGCGVSEVAVAVSPLTGKDVRSLLGDGSSYGVRFTYLDLGEGATAVETLLAARDGLGEHPLLVHSGDAVMTGGLDLAVEDFNHTRPDVLLLSQPLHSFPEMNLVGVRGSGHRDSRSLGGLDHVAPAAIVSPEALRELDGFEADTPTIGGTVAALAESGVTVSGRSLDGCWCYAGESDHLLEGNRMILDEIPHAPVEAELESVRIEGRVAIHPNARLERTTVRGPAVIGGGAVLIDTFVGPYSSIGAGVQLEGAEIEHSIVLERASIRHLGQRVEASVIGVDADISRDFGMPSAARLNVGRGSSVTLA